jgi:pimeloyl-ACP methyl ester carboxylesterase
VKIALLILACVFLCAGHAHAQVAVTTGSLEGLRGCEITYERYEPALAATESVVILAHGFRRSLANMRGWAQDWSALGLPVVIPSLCNSSWLRGRHRENADDLVALRRHLGIQSVVYAGFSAGGLSAYLAALDDPMTRAYLGLDSVDSGDLASDQSERLNTPALFLFGDATRCNARRNFMAVATRWAGYEQRVIEGAGHCHFERPWDKRCAWFCGGSKGAEVEDSQARIYRLATTWLLQVLNVIATVPD